MQHMPSRPGFNLRRALLRLTLGLLLAAWVAGAAHAQTVTDDSGRTLALARPAQRIVSLAPHITELLFSAGAGAQVVGVIEFSDYPAAARRLPRIGGAYGLDLERIAALKPDLVIAWSSGNSTAQVERIESLGIPVYRSEPATLEDVARSVERFGQLSGHADLARQVAGDFRGRIARLRQTYAQRIPVKVFYQVWPQPLMTVGGPHVITDVLNLCGGRNIFSSLLSPGPTVSTEAVLAAAPRLIIGGAAEGGDAASLAIWKRWPSLPAIKHQGLLVLDAALITRHTVRIAEGAEQLCRAIDAARAAP